MVETYASKEDVNDRLQQDGFGANTIPSGVSLNDILEEASDTIDYGTLRAWRLRYSKTENGEEDSYTEYEYQDLTDDELINGAFQINFLNRDMRNFDSAEGDVLEIWDGAQYVDYLADKTEGRASDWWLENPRGIVHINSFSFSDATNINLTSGFPSSSAVRAKYRYGKTVIPKIIKKACIYLAAAEVAKSQDKTFRFPQGGDLGESLSIPSKIETWESKANKIIKEYRQHPIA